MRRLRDTLLMLVVWLICQATHVLASLSMLIALLIRPRGGRAWTIAVAYDQLANATFGGHEDETLSSRAAKARMRGERWGCLVCGVLDWIDPGHCDRAVEWDEG